MHHFGHHHSSDFQNLRKFVFKYGDRKTYRNFDSNNPHYRFDDFDVYLGTGDQRASLETKEIKVKEYTELVIHDGNYHTFYLTSSETENFGQGHLEKGKVYWHNQNYQDAGKAAKYLAKLKKVLE